LFSKYLIFNVGDRERKKKLINTYTVYSLFDFLPGDLLPAIGFTARLSKGVYFGGHETVIYDDVLTNYGKGYRKLFGHFKAPISGLYLFSCTVMTKKDQHVHLEIVQNGFTVQQIYSGYDTNTQTIVLRLKKRDKVWVRHFVTAGYLEPWYNTFSGALI
jgi:hypothetical protein